MRFSAPAVTSVSFLTKRVASCIVPPTSQDIVSEDRKAPPRGGNRPNGPLTEACPESERMRVFRDATSIPVFGRDERPQDMPAGVFKGRKKHNESAQYLRIYESSGAGRRVVPYVKSLASCEKPNAHRPLIIADSSRVPKSSRRTHVCRKQESKRKPSYPNCLTRSKRPRQWHSPIIAD